MTGFIVAGSQRTGTSLIVSTLRSHPDICCHGEVFLYSRGRGKNIEASYRHFINQKKVPRTISHYLNRDRLIGEYLDYTYANTDSEAVGFKLMLDQVREFPEIRAYLQKKSIRILHVIRENVLKTMVSRVSAMTRGRYHSNEKVELAKIQLPVRGLLTNLDALEKEILDWRRYAAESPYLCISYETFNAGRDVELQKAQDFLGVDYKPMASTLKKLNSDNLVDVVENYDELVMTLSGTRHERFLDF